MFRNHKSRPARRPSTRVPANRVEQLLKNPNYKYELTRSF
jgi:hypothetical protein